MNEGQNELESKLGRIALAQADACAASRFLTECLVIRRATDDPRGTGLTLHLLGDAHLACGSDIEAARCYREALQIFQVLGHQAGSENILAALAGLATRDPG